MSVTSQTRSEIAYAENPAQNFQLDKPNLAYANVLFDSCWKYFS